MAPLRSHLRDQRCTPCEKTAPDPVLRPHCIFFKQDAAHRVCGACRLC